MDGCGMVEYAQCNDCNETTLWLWRFNGTRKPTEKELKDAGFIFCRGKVKGRKR
jgi:hypothetical protein